MRGWRVSDEMELGFTGVGRVIVRAAGGRVRVRTAPGPVRCAVRHHSGEPIEVDQSGGTLRIRQPSGAGEAAIDLSLPPNVDVDVTGETADVLVEGPAKAARVQTVSRPATRAKAS